MTEGERIPRDGLLWLLVAQLLVILPHLGHLPYWIVLLWLLCAGWRFQVFRQRARYPRSWLKILLLLATGFAVYFSRGSLVGLEAGTVLLIAAFMLKLLEMRSRRDALVVIFLGFFAVVTGYLFEDSLLAAAYSVLPVTALLAAMIALHRGEGATRPWDSLRLAGSLLLQALPLMLVLFVLFPRLGPLWGMPQPSARGMSGLAESMAPGEIAELGQSPALAFRASFEGPPPPRERLYWRAITFEQFDGQRWSRGVSALRPEAPRWQPQGEPVDYSIVMQPSGQPWLYTLDVPEVAPGEARLMADFHLQRRNPVNQPLLYSLRSWPQAQREAEGAADSLHPALQLPEQGNRRARAWARQLRERYPDPPRLVEALLRHFNREPFVYTLRPAPVGEDIIDGFLFDSRSGFCIHYAGAMTFVLRAAGIPARVVGGYQGGEWNPDGDYLAVRQFDAHAWVEYWLPGRGWISVDPTFQVAPERIRLGLEAALAEEEDFLAQAPLSLMHYRDIPWLNALRLSWDSANYGWQRWVLGYQAERQRQLLERWFGGLGVIGAGLLLVAALGLAGAVLALVLLRPQRQGGDAGQRLLAEYERLLGRQGVCRLPGEGVGSFAFRAAKALPYQAEAITAFAERFEAYRYAGEEGALVELQAALALLRKRLPWRRSATARVEPED